MHLFVRLAKQYWQFAALLAALTIVSLIYATHLELVMIPKGYDLLFHLGNVFSLQVAFGFTHKSLASLFISPVIFHDYGYGTHLFYPPLAHFVPAAISFVLSKIGINSTLLAVRLFSFLTIFFSGASMYFAAKKMTNNFMYAAFASLLYLSAPYLQWDYYWRGGMTSSLCFVFLPLLLLSFSYFVKEKFAPYFFALVTSMTLLMWTHVITAFYSFVLFMIAVVLNFFWIKKKKAAVITTLIAGVVIAMMTSPFWVLLLQQQMLHTHVINSDAYPFTIESVSHNTIPFTDLFDLQVFVWQWKIRNLFAVFNLISLILFIAVAVFFKPIKNTLKSSRFLYSLIGGLLMILTMVTFSPLWKFLPDFFAYIQYPPRLLLQATPIAALIIALPFVLIRKMSGKAGIALFALAVLIVAYTFKFNNYALYNIGQTDYTTFSIIQATGVDDEYLPVASKKAAKALEERSRTILALTNTANATPAATIVTNETPYLLAKIEKNEKKETAFELPRLFYAGYDIRWKANGNENTTSLTYGQSDRGLITTTVEGNGTLEVQFTGGKWYPFACFAAVAATLYVLWLWYTTVIKKNNALPQ